MEAVEPEGDFFDALARRYALTYEPPVGDHPLRVALIMRPIASAANSTCRTGCAAPAAVAGRAGRTRGEA